jgi:uncharacterized protein (TIGR00369 family)
MPLSESELRSFVETAVPFHQFLGLRLLDWQTASPQVTIQLALRPEFTGNPVMSNPHGGLLSALIDAAAISAALVALGDIGLMAKAATIDMRVDYLQVAQGSTLIATARVMRGGRSIMVVQSEINDATDAPIALGTSVFRIGRG